MLAFLRVFSMVLAVVAATTSTAGPRLEERGRLRLDGSLRLASDVRFLDQHTLMLASRKFGVAKVHYEGRGVRVEEMILPEGAGGIVLAEHLGVSADHFAAASPASQLIWMERRAGGATGMLGTWGSPKAPISFFEDIDVQGDRLAILGLMRSDTGMSPDGAVAWQGTMPPKGEVELKPLVYSLNGPGARPFARCSTFEVGKIRFLPDGRLLVVPGAEPGAFLYSASGKLERTWDTVRMGLDLRCDFDDTTSRVFASDGTARLAYIDQFVTVDEILPTALGPALMIRSVKDKKTSWRMVLLLDDGSTQEIDTHLSSSAAFAYLRGDVLGNRVVLLLRSYSYWEDNPGTEILEMELHPGLTPGLKHSP